MRSHMNHRSLHRSLTAAAVLAAAALLVGCAAGPFSGLVGDAAPVADTPVVDAPAAETPAGQAPAGEAPAAESPVDAADGAHTATLVLDGQSFTFSPTTCMSGDEDVLVSGPGVDDGSQEPAFLDIDFVRVDLGWDGEVRIDLGTDQPMSTTERFYSIRVGGDDDHSVGQVAFDDVAELRVDGIVREGGEAELGEGTLEVTCS
ncbi:hypothetical protein [Homoserinimonas sp. OAct 916]|uniref:hypothetical protein n=1 Tax=Homoserinimonas sp. OAct 916 TaxID=2211450 RepID=UPI001E4F3A37|nr:hypothetical protein [Homoserinimonas sp. OAct 916]